MKMFGSWKELVSIVWRKNSQDITIRPNQSTTYTASRDIQTPPQDANSILVSENATQSLTNKTLANSTTASLKDSLFTLQDDGDATKLLAFQLSGITTGTTRTLTVPDLSDTLVTKTSTDILTNKTLTAPLITTNGSIDVTGAGTLTIGASMGANNLTLGPATGKLIIPSFVQFNNYVVSAADNTKQFAFDFTSQTTGTTTNLAFSSSVSRTLTLPNATDTLVGQSTTDTLSNKTLASPIVSTQATYANQAEVRFAEQTGNGTNYVGFKAPDAVTANKVFKLPDGDGTPNQFLKTDGSLNLSWATPSGSGESVTTKTNTDYAILDGDGFTTILVSTGSSDRTITLPAPANNTSRQIRIKKIDSGTGKVLITRNSSESIDADTSKTLSAQYESNTVQTDGTNWYITANESATQLDRREQASATYGSTATKIPNITTSVRTSGSGVFVAASDSTNGLSYTFNKKARVWCQWQVATQTGGRDLGISLNASVTTNFDSLSTANQIAWSITNSADNRTLVTAIHVAASGDVIRPHGKGETLSTAASNCTFTMMAEAIE